DDQLPSRADLEQPFLQEQTERMANRSARAAERTRQLGLGEDASHRELTAEYRAADIAVRLCGEAATRGVSLRLHLTGYGVGGRADRRGARRSAANAMATSGTPVRTWRCSLLCRGHRSGCAASDRSRHQSCPCR